MKIKQLLNFKNYGIFAATCKDLYNGQTINILLKVGMPSKHIESNISKLNHEIKNQFALTINYKKIHKEKIPEQIENAYTVQFLESPTRTNLDTTKH